MKPGRLWLDGSDLSLAAFETAVLGPVEICFAKTVDDRIGESEARLDRLIDDGALLYGITTGFGPLAGRHVSPQEAQRLQRGLIYHLASGVGPPLSWQAARALCLARLNCLARGHSGAGRSAIAALQALLASPLAPCVPEKGTVGASGDLTPMAHVVLSLMGEGPFITDTGDLVPASEGLEILGRGALVPSARDGLALVNGTAAMTGVAALNHNRAARLIAWSEVLGTALGEVLRARAEAWDPVFGQVRPHPGQQAAHGMLAAAMAGSAWLQQSPIAALRQGRTCPSDAVAGDAEAATHGGVPAPPQDAYTLRCLPQLTGAARDILRMHGECVRRELNATTDNPIFPGSGLDAAPAALHGGNFMGQHVALASDALSTAVLSVAGLAERQIARVTDERLNGGLPPFLTRGSVGIDSGLMGAQVTATALLAEMRSRAVPASVLSISTNAANQDVVSMGTIAARATARHLDDAASILAILALAVAQGVDIRRHEDATRDFAPATRRVVAAIRDHSPPLLGDRPLSAEIAALARWLDRTAVWHLVPGLPTDGLVD